MKFLKFTFAAAIFSISASVNAALIDFTDDYWQSNSSITIDGLTASVTAYNSNGQLTNFSSGQAFDGSNNAYCGTLACEIDGLGVGDDEITYSSSGKFSKAERIRVSFSETVNVDYVLFLDLFAAGANSSDPKTESAKASGNTSSGNVVWDGVALDDTGWFLATETNREHGTGSILSLEFIEFFTKNANASSNSDFALAAMEVTTVPAPSALLLLGIGLAGLGFVRRDK